mmetsp:Transcript_19557/g.25321  ORF Transcript_19557/g.25321 Transcript_19557/m.25321 type:complete len:354 (+) Transcript_19557:31-1092(+)
MVDEQKSKLSGSIEEGSATSSQQRPPPRRRREQSEASAFLSKTYSMIDSLPAHIGGWSEAGDTMVILDSERFASEYIPQYFKHNNFRSFVRQLNFYGFRKLRADAASGTGANRWEFKHANFRRGHPELLVQIRRAEHYDYTAPDAAAQRQRQAELEREVSELRQRVDEMQLVIENLNRMLTSLTEALQTRETNAQNNSHSLERSNITATSTGGSATHAEPAEDLGPTPALRPTSLQIINDLSSFSSLDGKPIRNGGDFLDADVINPKNKRSASLLGRSLEGKPLKRLRTGDKSGMLNSLDGQPLERRLSTFETSRLDSLIRTLGDDEIPLPLLNLPLDENRSLPGTQEEPTKK